MICPFPHCRLTFPNATQLQHHRGKLHRWQHAPKGFSPEKWLKIIEEEIANEEGRITEIFSERVVNDKREFLCMCENEQTMWRTVGNRCAALLAWKKRAKKKKFCVPLIQFAQQRQWQTQRLSREDKSGKKEKKVVKKKYGKKK